MLFGLLCGCQSSGLESLALAHAHQTLEGPSTPDEAAAQRQREKDAAAKTGAPDDSAPADTEGENAAADSEGDSTVSPMAPALDAAQVFRANAAQLFRMSWQTRTRLQLRGTEVLEVLHKVQIDENGDLSRRVLSSRQRSSAQVDSGVSAGADWEADAETLSDLVYAYTVTSMGAVARAVDGQAVIPMAGGLQSVSGPDAVIPGDRVTMEFSHAGELKALYVETMLDASPVSGEVHYRKLPHGPAYPARAQLKHPVRELQATVESFSFRTF